MSENLCRTMDLSGNRLTISDWGYSLAARSRIELTDSGTRCIVDFMTVRTSNADDGEFRNSSGYRVARLAAAREAQLRFRPQDGIVMHSTRVFELREWKSQSDFGRRANARASLPSGRSSECPSGDTPANVH